MLRSMSDGVSDPVLNKIGAKHHELKQQYDEMSVLSKIVSIREPGRRRRRYGSKKTNHL